MEIQNIFLLGFYISFSDAVPVASNPHDVDGERVHYHRRRRREVRHRIGPLHACQGTKYKKNKNNIWFLYINPW